MRRRALAMATVTMLPLAAFTPASAALPGEQDRRGPTQRIAAQSIGWKPCHKRHRDTNRPQYRRLECATLKAPLDWKKPSGKKITLAISRLKARKQVKGVLFTNPGGPGAAGWTLPLIFIDTDRARLLDHMDIIGIDIRGTGYSTQASCKDAYGGTYDSRDRSRSNIRAMLFWAQEQAKGCQKYGGKKLPSKYVTTAQTVYDLEWIRRNLKASDGRKVKKVHWVGYSGGTWIGAYYARKWPKSTGRFVLDGVVDFSGSWQSFFDTQPKAFQARFEAFARWAAQYDDAYGLGGSQKAVLATYERVRAVAAKKYGIEVTRPDGRIESFSADQIDYTIISALYSKYLFADLALTLKDLVSAATGDASRKPLAGRAAQNPYAGETPTFYNLTCNDTPNTRNPRELVKFSGQSGKKYPLAGYSRLMDPCAYWKKVPGGLKLSRPVGGGLPRVLMVHSMGDPATPYIGAVKAHKAYQNSRLVTVADEGDHGIYAGDNPCVNDIVENYLIDGVYPRRDVTCQGTAASVPRVADRAADRPVNPLLRAWELSASGRG
ncbi:alpha/beta hydrolase [Actinocorallia sp. B10E7]|uniref:alpha/beta hydrolase n=1 Tax=Actinocorallia sp. B10E7 TaxID=3153558 RepID=UPI00325F4E57